jgi:uncharacterized surface protein with fasciclin (FAS1) repeats
MLIVAVLTLALAALLVVAAGCGSSSESSPSPSPTIAPTIVPSVSTDTLREAAATGDLGSFVKAVTAAGLGSSLDSQGPFTLFAPNEDAFRSISLTDLRQNLPRLKAIVQYHVLPDTDLKLAQVVSGQEYRTAEGQAVTLSIVDGTTMVNDATVVQVVEGGTWTIYVIDQVLTPPVAGASPSP